jgi:hypothetical protein
MLRKLKKLTSSEFCNRLLMLLVITSDFYLFFNVLIAYFVMNLLELRWSMKNELHQCRC